MPIYEFYCPGNHRIYSFFARSLAYANRVPRCPDDPTLPLQREISRFAVTGRAKEPQADAAGEDPRMESLMLEMERDFGDLAESENPDPRRMAQMMRRMSAATGEPLGGAMEEMLARMERGEDPEKLEEEYGSALEQDGGGTADAAGPSAPSLARTMAGRLRSAPARDPKLYEMSEYCD
ncbi:MAG: cytochrome C [Verrucomicrobia bacterium]|nr:cytochrome C [Verrucomicrobiota bacterium]